MLYQPEIPPNTGNIIRLCANTGAALHLIKPYGFDLCDRQLRRAGLDYAETARIVEHETLEGFVSAIRPARLLACSTQGRQRYDRIRYGTGDAVLFGPETRGLPAQLLGRLGADSVLYIPMLPGNRSLNLSNAVSVVVYEAWRQQEFVGVHPR